jgi:YVTN family beta-propeller protein
VTAPAYAADSDTGVLAIIDTKPTRLSRPFRSASSRGGHTPPDGRWMLVPNNGDSTVVVIDTTTQKIVAKLNAGPEMTGVNFAAGGRKAYVIS